MLLWVINLNFSGSAKRTFVARSRITTPPTAARSLTVAALVDCDIGADDRNFSVASRDDCDIGADDRTSDVPKED